MNRMIFSQVAKLIRMQNIHIPGSTFVTSQHANACSPVRLSNTKPPLGVALPEKSTNDFVKVWVCDKLVTACLIPAMPWAIIYPSKVGDSLLATFIGAHVFFGLGAIQNDYIRPQFFGNFLTYVAKALVYLISLVVLGGFFYIIQYDIGIANILRRLWAIRGGSKSSPLSLFRDDTCSSTTVDIVKE